MTKRNLERSRALLALALALAVLPAAAQINCTRDDITAQPVTFNIDYETQIQPLWAARCSNCHIVNTSGGLSLSPGNPATSPPASLAQLVNVPSVNLNAGMPRVTPGDAERSFLWKKINCTDLNSLPSTPFGLRMPRGGGMPMTLAQQALIYDWIQAGAQTTPSPGDVIYAAGYEPRF